MPLREISGCLKTSAAVIPRNLTNCFHESNPTVWQTIQTDADIAKLMDAFGHFHDSCLYSIHFQTGVYVNDNLAMVMDVNPCAHIIFHRQHRHNHAIELRLRQICKLHINIDLCGTLEILGAYLEQRDGWFYWYDHRYDESIWFQCKEMAWRAW